MGCTWISVVSLIVLIFTSFLANMKAVTITLPTVTTEEETLIQSSPVSTTVPSKLMSSETVTTRNKVDTKCHSSGIDGLQNANFESGKNNISETKCTYSDNVTTQAVTSIGTEAEKKPALAVTYRDFPEYIHYKNLERIIPFLTNIPGFITNTLTIVIASHIKSHHTSEIYMIVLGCTDLLTVTARFTYRMIELYSETKSSAYCKILSYILTVAQVYSNLILVSWTLERFIAVIFPIKLASWCSIRNTKITSGLLLLFCMAITIPYITEVDAINIWNGKTLVNVCQFSEFMYSTWTHIESVYYIYLPMMLVCTCNLAILCRLNTMTKARINMASNQDTIDKKSKENRKMTILLLSISGTFIFLHIPHAIALVVGYMHPDLIVFLLEDPHGFAKYLLYVTCGFFVTEFQNSINFFLYCITGTKFRSTFKRIICCHSTVKRSETNTQTSNTRSTTF
ncbi:somatostatin receptor type 2-like [Mercenaria mercenaria]|uniref:somatostatin receptor type 2-like n=1 Tax=Mercenaria mercenaria TaxID=6596 RepID=UPI00234F40C7|nr:somatostatin receptor type 2-like [Mercenaria mercenaria]